MVRLVTNRLSVSVTATLTMTRSTSTFKDFCAAQTTPATSDSATPISILLRKGIKWPHVITRINLIQVVTGLQQPAETHATPGKQHGKNSFSENMPAMLGGVCAALNGEH